MESAHKTIELGSPQILVVLTVLSINPHCFAMFDGRAEVAFSSTPSFALKDMRFSSWDLYPLLPAASANQANLHVLTRFAPSARYAEHTAPIRHTERLPVCLWNDLAGKTLSKQPAGYLRPVCRWDVKLPLWSTLTRHAASLCWQPCSVRCLS